MFGFPYIFRITRVAKGHSILRGGRRKMTREQFEARMESIFAYQSQYQDQQAGSSDFPAFKEIRERVATMAGFYGLLAGVKYAEPFVQKEVGLVEDLMLVPVKSI